MSHNKIKIGTATPDATGVIAVELNDLSNVDVSGASDGSALRYVSAEWTHAPSVSASYATAGYAAGWSTYTSGGGNSYTATGALNSYRTFDVTNWEDTSSSVQITFGGLDLDRGTEGGTIPSATVSLASFSTKVSIYSLRRHTHAQATLQTGLNGSGETSTLMRFSAQGGGSTEPLKKT